MQKININTHRNRGKKQWQMIQTAIANNNKNNKKKTIKEK